jgi:nucleoid-associated protein Lsr2
MAAVVANSRAGAVVDVGHQRYGFAVRIVSAIAKSKGKAMAKAKVEVLVDDLDGSAGVETVRLGWNGDWRELDLSQRNLAALSRVLDRYWAAGRPVRADRKASRRRRAAPARSKKAGRDPKTIRAWATANGIAVPTRGRIPGEVERQYNEANAAS